MPGISGREEQIGTETEEKKNCPPKEGIEQVAQLAFQSLCSLCSFLFPPDKVLSEKRCFGMQSVFHAAEPVGSEMTPSRVMSVPVGKALSEQQQTLLHICFLTLYFLTTRADYAPGSVLRLSVIC